MYKVITYKDRTSKDEITDYIQELNSKIATSNKIFFAYWKDNVFVLLHYFIKKAKKTLPQEIKQAERNLKDFKIALVGKLIEAREQKGISQKACRNVWFKTTGYSPS